MPMVLRSFGLKSTFKVEWPVATAPGSETGGTSLWQMLQSFGSGAMPESAL